MKKLMFPLIILVLLLSACSGGEPAAATAPPAPEPAEMDAVQSLVEQPVSPPATTDIELTFTLYGDEAVLSYGSVEQLDWDRVFVEPGAVVFHQGLYHLFYNGNVSCPKPGNVGYATSTDGFTWARMTNEPIFKADEVDYAERGIMARSVLVEDDGTWVMFFHTWNEGSLMAPGAIGRATASAPVGPWKPTDKPVIEPGPEGAWDGYAVHDPSVVRTEAGYVMYYTGIDDFFGTLMIGRATSLDGLSWTKYDDPVTTETLFAESDPIFGPDEPDAWDAKHILRPSVQRTPEGWVMLYSSIENPTEVNSRLGYATSGDGFHWTRAIANPILEEQSHIMWGTHLLYHNGTYLLYFEGQDDWGSQIYLATAGKPLAERIPIQP